MSAIITSPLLTEVSSLSTETLILEIEGRAGNSDQDAIDAALILKELRRRIVAGELGPDVKWMAWIRTTIGLSPSRLYELMQIADAANPHQKLEQLRRLNREKQKAFRDRSKAKEETPGPARHRDRTIIIEWARNAPLKDIRQIRKEIDALRRPAT